MTITQAGLLTQYSESIDWITSIETGVSATGTNHATGYDITKHETIVTGGTASTADHLSLPEFATLTYQDEFIIDNQSGITQYVIPESGDDIGNGVGVAVALPDGTISRVKVTSKAASGLGSVITGGPNTHIITGNTTLTRQQMTDATLYVTAAAVLTMLAKDAKTLFSVKTMAAVAVSVKAAAADRLFHDGTPLDDGDKLTNGSTIGDSLVVRSYDVTGCDVTTDGNWTDTGA